jgi:hypothetical protein
MDKIAWSFFYAFPAGERRPQVLFSVLKKRYNYHIRIFEERI